MTRTLTTEHFNNSGMQTPHKRDQAALPGIQTEGHLLKQPPCTSSVPKQQCYDLIKCTLWLLGKIRQNPI